MRGAHLGEQLGGLEAGVVDDLLGQRLERQRELLDRVLLEAGTLGAQRLDAPRQLHLDGARARHQPPVLHALM